MLFELLSDFLKTVFISVTQIGAVFCGISADLSPDSAERYYKGSKTVLPVRMLNILVDIMSHCSISYLFLSCVLDWECVINLQHSGS